MYETVLKVYQIIIMFVKTDNEWQSYGKKFQIENDHLH